VSLLWAVWLSRSHVFLAFAQDGALAVYYCIKSGETRLRIRELEFIPSCALVVSVFQFSTRTDSMDEEDACPPQETRRRSERWRALSE
jgi:hypothetical protein